jgi:hypothetical protein
MRSSSARRAKNALYLQIQSVPQRKQHVSMTTISCLMLFKEIIAVYYENQTNPINILCGQNTELLIVEAGGTYSYHRNLKG